VSRGFSGKHLGEFWVLAEVLFGRFPFVIGELALK
jgi:hypothetical protein